MTVADLSRRMGATELDEWRAYAEIEPFGERRADLRAWAVIAQLANVNRGENVKAHDLGAILPEWKPPAPRQTDAEMAAALDRYFTARMTRTKGDADG